MTSELRRGLQVLREEGPITLVSRARQYAARYELTRDGIEKSYQTGTRVDFGERLSMIISELDGSDHTLLDIGCAEGDFTASLADNMISFGIERQHHVVSSARRRHKGVPNVGFLQFEVTPETVDRLPNTDVVLLLAVYHHWVREFGEEQSNEMLQKVVDSSEKVFFEIPDNRLDGWKTAIEGDVRLLGRVDYKGGNRDDLLYVIQ